VFGLKGLVLGPVLMSLAVAVLRLYATETRLRRHITRASMSDKPVLSTRTR
jgi:predicted PurR-regulated permease PerM